jgi:hypothetical protein
MKLSRGTQRFLSIMMTVLFAVSVVAVVGSVSALSVKAQDDELEGCTDTSCWPDYTYICQRISRSCHCDGTWCKQGSQ